MNQFDMLIDEDWYQDNKEILHATYDELYDMEQLMESYEKITKLYEDLCYMALA